jgi:hypothetical protein
MYTIFSVVQRQQRKSDVMTSFGHTACSAVYYQVPRCRFLIENCPPTPLLWNKSPVSLIKIQHKHCTVIAHPN